MTRLRFTVTLPTDRVERPDEFGTAGAVMEMAKAAEDIYVPAYRNPFLTAKAVATLDALTGGRVIFGVAAGYLRGEFDALGVPFEGRGSRLDTALLAMQQAWTGEPVEMKTQHWAAHGNVGHRKHRGPCRPHTAPGGNGYGSRPQRPSRCVLRTIFTAVP
jgi:hypothetical protein